MSTRTDERTPVDIGIQESTARSLDRMSEHPEEGLGHVENEIPPLIAGIRSFEQRLNNLGKKEALVKDWQPLYPDDWSLTQATNQFLLLSRSKKGWRGKQVTEIVREGVKAPKKRFLDQFWGNREWGSTE